MTDDDKRNANNEINSFSDTIISEDAQNQLPPLPESILSPVLILEAQPLDTQNEELEDSSEEENVR